MSPVPTLGVLLASLLCVAGVAVAQQVPTPPAPPIEVTCEDQLATWKENGSSFIQQILTMEAAARTMRRAYGTVVAERDEARHAVVTVTQERDAALATLTALEGSPAAPRAPGTN